VAVITGFLDLEYVIKCRDTPRHARDAELDRLRRDGG
jgi:hypothetical protein